MIKGQDLQNRMGGGSQTAATSSPNTPVITEDALASLLARIDKARTTKDGEERHCADCFRRGRDAAPKIIDGA